MASGTLINTGFAASEKVLKSFFFIKAHSKVIHMWITPKKCASAKTNKTKTDCASRTRKTERQNRVARRSERVALEARYVWARCRPSAASDHPARPSARFFCEKIRLKSPCRAAGRL